MSKYKKATKELRELATAVLEEFETHQPVLDAKVDIEFLWAFGERDEHENLISDALTSRGHRVLGVTRKTNEKERVAGRADVEIILDADHWKDINENQQKALLDHELHHIEVMIDQDGKVIKDGAGRPKIKLRRHDVEVGWFKIIAERHGKHAEEVIQAKLIFDQSGQAFFPFIEGQKAKRGSAAKKDEASPFTPAVVA